MRGTCATCAHWSPPPGAKIPARPDLGLCRRIEHQEEAAPGDPAVLNETCGIHGAWLSTAAGFGCTLWSAVPAPAPAHLLYLGDRTAVCAAPDRLGQEFILHAMSPSPCRACCSALREHQARRTR